MVINPLQGNCLEILNLSQNIYQEGIGFILPWLSGDDSIEYCIQISMHFQPKLEETEERNSTCFEIWVKLINFLPTDKVSTVFNTMLTSRRRWCKDEYSNFKEIPNREFEEHLLKRSQRPTSNRDKVATSLREMEKTVPLPVKLLKRILERDSSFIWIPSCLTSDEDAPTEFQVRLSRTWRECVESPVC